MSYRVLIAGFSFISTQLLRVDGSTVV